MTNTQTEHASIMWNTGYGTKEIADTLQVPEPEVYNSLQQIKTLAAFKKRVS